MRVLLSPQKFGLPSRVIGYLIRQPNNCHKNVTSIFHGDIYRGQLFPDSRQRFSVSMFRRVICLLDAEPQAAIPQHPLAYEQEAP